MLRACLNCLTSWSNVNMRAGQSNRSICVPCCDRECEETIVEELWQLICSRDQPLLELENDLLYRRRLQHNSPFPAQMQVDSPISLLVGADYVGQETAECLSCKHQFSAGHGTMSPCGEEGAFDASELKQCPQCQMWIEKNGGYDHMRCHYGFVSGGQH